MPRLTDTRPNPRRSPRRLRVEPLEPRQMLSAGYLVHDSFADAIGFGSSDLFWVELNEQTGEAAVDHLGAMNVEMDDIAYRRGVGLFAVDHADGFPSGLYEVLIDFSDPDPVVTGVQWKGTINFSTVGRVDVNSLEFGPNGNLFAVGTDLGRGVEAVFEIFNLDGAGARRLVDLPGHFSAGDVTFDEDGYLYVTTTAGDLVRVDVAAAAPAPEVVGSTGFTDLYGLTYGPGPKMFGFRSQQDVYRISRETATATLVTSLGNPVGGPVVHGISGATTLHEPPTVLGEMDFVERVGEPTVLGERWYRFEAARDAYVTAELPGADPAAEIDVTLYRQDTGTGQLTQLATGVRRMDYDAGAAGQRYYLQIAGAGEAVDVRLANLFRIAGNGAEIFGSDEADTFQFFRRASPRYTMIINGVDYAFNFIFGVPVNITFDGGVGRDEARLTGADDRGETAHLNLAARTGSLFRDGDYRVDVVNAPEITIDGGGGSDTAVLRGSGTSDILRADPTTARFTGLGAVMEAANMETVAAYAVSGQVDRAYLTGNTGGGVDSYLGQPGLGRLSGPGYLIRAHDFDRYEVDAAGSPGDIARFRHFAGDETLVADPDTAELTVTPPGADTVVHRVEHFPEVRVYAGDDGTDTAILTDSPGDDLFSGRLFRGTLSDKAQSDYSILVDGFDTLEVTSFSGDDEAWFFGSVESDTYNGTPTEGEFTGLGYVNRALSFPTIHVFPKNGDADSAVLRGLPGRDQFQGTWVYGRLAGGSAAAGTAFFHRVVRAEKLDVYPTEVGVAATADDVARLLDSPWDDQLNGTPTATQMRLRTGPGDTQRFDQTVHDFPVVLAFATEGGFDEANLTGNAGDVYLAAPRKLIGDDYLIWLKTDFESITVDIPAAALAAPSTPPGGGRPREEDRSDREAAVDLLMTVPGGEGA